MSQFGDECAVIADDLEERGASRDIVAFLRDADKYTALMQAAYAHHECLPPPCWLTVLCRTYRGAYDPNEDEDVVASSEMMNACLALGLAIEATIPTVDRVP